MKKVVVLLLALVMMLSCMGMAEEMKDPNIAVYTLAPHPFFDSVIEGVVKWVEEGGMTADVSCGSDWTQEGMNTGVLALAGKGYKNFVLYPADASATNGLYQDLVDFDCNIVNFGCSTVEPTPAALCFMTPMAQSAADALEWLIGQLGGKGNIIVIIERVDDPNNILRLEGVEGVLAKYPDIKVLQQIWGMATEAEAISAIEPVFSSFSGQIDGIIALGGTASLGMQTVIREYEEATGDHVISIGIDDDAVTLGNIRDGYLDATYAQNPRGMGYLSCEALKLMENGYVPAEGVYNIPSGSVIVTKDNVDTYQEEMWEVTYGIAEALPTQYMVKAN